MRRDVFHAISDPTRRAIIMLLAMTSLTPNDIAGHFEISRQAVSKHIKILTECELLIQEQQGRTIYYHLKSEKMEEIEQWLEAFRSLLSKRFDQLDQLLTQLKKSNNE